MSYSFRDKPRLSERIRGKSGDELFNELKEQFDQDRKMFFEASPKWGPGPTSASFPRTGFPFDDDMMPRGRQDIRSHLDDLAARHPEFADHLRCPPWGGEVGSTQTRGQMHRESDCDDDARSQASGVSTSSSEPHGPEMGAPGPLPQYGLRNTVDLGQKQQEADQEEKQGRGQRSMSAPPDNRSQQSEQPQRFVSRIEIPMNAAGATSSSAADAPGKPPVAPKQQQSQQSHSNPSKLQGNVRHIPIFVEGRDEPILPKNVAPDHVDQPFAPRTVQPEVDHIFSPRQSQPTHSYARPSQFYPQQTFVQQPAPASPKQQRHSKPQQTVPIKVQQASHSPKTATKSPSRQGEHTVPIKVQHTSQQQPKSQHTSAPQQPAKPPSKPPEPVAKDPISRVKMVQKDVEQLRSQVQQYSGTSRKEKEYIYLDEMLTRNLLKLDDIDTEGKENVRQARKEVIKMIQQCISELEAKVPVPEEVPPSDEQEAMDEVPSELSEERPSQEEHRSENPSGHEMDVAQINNSAAVQEEKQEGVAASSSGETENQVDVQRMQTEPNKEELKDAPKVGADQKNESQKVEGLKEGAQEVQDIPMECIEDKGRATEGGEEIVMPVEGIETKLEGTDTTAVNGTGESIALPDCAGKKEMSMEIDHQEANSSELQKPEVKLGDESNSIPEQQVQEAASSQSS